jgi:hypothetical protein
MKSRLILTLILLAISLAREAQAFYNPSSGRWLSRDPICETGGINLYASNDNDDIDRTDRNGHVSIYRSQGEVDLCSQVDLLYKINLDDAPFDDGYIVQHLTISAIGEDCAGHVELKSGDFYELLGGVVKKDAPPSLFGGWFVYDANTFPYRPLGSNHRGNIILHREVNFFYKDITGDLEKLWPANSIPGFITGPAVKRRPLFWDAGAETWARNTWTVSYHCCCGHAGLPSFFDTAPGRPVELDY